MNFYKKTYRKIGIIVIIVGIAILPFIKFFCKDDVPIDINISILYLIYLANSALSYFLFAYKNCLLLAHQQNYVSSNVNTVVNVILNVLQAIFLLSGKSYYIYVILIVLATIANNIINAVFATKRYPQYKAEGNISEERKGEIYKKVKALFFYKIGGIVLSSIDSIVISSFLGLSVLGKYNNYYYVISTLFGFIQVYASAMIAGVGNSIASENVNKNKSDFEKINFVHIWIISWCSICLLCLYQHFMKMWIGSENLLPTGIVIALSLYFYVWKTLDIVNLYKEAAGLWEFDQFRPLVASVVNFIINVILVQFIGLYGIVISTIVAIIIVIFPWSTYILFREYFKNGYKKFIIKNVFNLIVTVIAGTISYILCSLIKNASIVGLIEKVMICIVIPNIVFLISYAKSKDFAEAVLWILNKMRLKNIKG